MSEVVRAGSARAEEEAVAQHVLFEWRERLGTCRKTKESPAPNTRGYRRPRTSNGGEDGVVEPGIRSLSERRSIRSFLAKGAELELWWI